MWALTAGRYPLVHVVICGLYRTAVGWLKKGTNMPGGSNAISKDKENGRGYLSRSKWRGVGAALPRPDRPTLPPPGGLSAFIAASKLSPEVEPVGEFFQRRSIHGCQQFTSVEIVHSQNMVCMEDESIPDIQTV